MRMNFNQRLKCFRNSKVKLMLRMLIWNSKQKFFLQSFNQKRRLLLQRDRNPSKRNKNLKKLKKKSLKFNHLKGDRIQQKRSQNQFLRKLILRNPQRSLQILMTNLMFQPQKKERNLRRRNQRKQKRSLKQRESPSIPMMLRLHLLKWKLSVMMTTMIQNTRNL